jgi:hypothetical protein
MKNNLINLINNILNRLFPHQEPRIPMFFDISKESWGERIARNGNMYHYISGKS